MAAALASSYVYPGREGDLTVRANSGPGSFSGAQTAALYGPSESRTADWRRQQEAASYDAYLQSFNNRTGRQGGVPRTSFYNTRAGGAVIAQAREDLSARARPVDANTQRSTVQDNRQRAYHSECPLRMDVADLEPHVQPVFQQYPLQEYNRFDLMSRTWSGPTTHPRLKSVPYGRNNGGGRPGGLDVPRRHDLVKNIAKKESRCNYNSGHEFVAKHTNNLVSC